MIKAVIKAQNTDANIGSYKDTCDSFSWSDIERMFSWHDTGRLNIAHEAIDRWAEDAADATRPALIFEKAGETKIYTYQDLKIISCQWANLLAEHGFETGDRLFIFLDSCPEIYFAMLACARLGVVFCPLFSSLNIDELEDRIKSAAPKGILTHPDLSERLPEDGLQDVDHVFLIQGPPPGYFKGETVIENLPEMMPETFKTRWLSKDAPFYLLFTSGSTGPPKGVVHAHSDMMGHLMSARFVLNLKKETILWTDCDPAWVTGTVYGAFAPWLCGATSVVQGDPYSASCTCRTLEQYRVEVWYMTPGTIRRLKEAGEDLICRYDLSRLRHAVVVGEALEPDLIYWFKNCFGISPHDTWWMTETGMICIANFLTMDIKPGAMGKPVPGIEAAVIDENGHPLPPMTMGELALKPGWPAMMTAIWQDEKRYQAYFRLKDWFLTGDMVIRDEDGYYYHQGRTDDLIKTGVKLVGPYEIERALCRHPAVSESAVIAKSARPGEHVLKAYIKINRGFTASSRLNQEIKAFVKAGLSSEINLKEIKFIEEIPKTLSGKILRRVLRAYELGLPVGNLSNMKEGGT